VNNSDSSGGDYLLRLTSAGLKAKVALQEDCTGTDCGLGMGGVAAGAEGYIWYSESLANRVGWVVP
jgi:hypothetical protein